MQSVGIPVSIGIASTKTLAKQASVLAKKTSGAQILLDPEWKTLRQTIECSSVWNIGRQTSAKLRGMGVVTVAEFLGLDRAVIKRHFGVQGERVWSELQGISVYDVGKTTDDVQHSIMSTRSFEKTTTNILDLESAVAYHVSFAAEKLREKKLAASRMRIALLTSRHSDFMLQGGSREVVLKDPTSHTQTLIHEALLLVRTLYKKGVPYKKAGAILSGLMPVVYLTNDLFSPEVHEEGKALDVVTDRLNERFGHGTIRAGVIGANPTRASAKLRSKEYTTRWKDIPTVKAR